MTDSEKLDLVIRTMLGMQNQMLGMQNQITSMQGQMLDMNTQITDLRTEMHTIHDKLDTKIDTLKKDLQYELILNRQAIHEVGHEVGQRTEAEL